MAIPSDTNPLPNTDTAPKIRPSVALLYGGTSSEREVSLASAAAVETVLEDAGYRLYKIDTGDPRFLSKLTQAQADAQAQAQPTSHHQADAKPVTPHPPPLVAFIALHGQGGEDGCMQGVLELMDIPYTGSGVLASALAMDKYRSKLLYAAAGLNTPRFVYLSAGQDAHHTTDPAEISAQLGLPCVIKPAAGGSSVGITIVRREQDIPQALSAAFALGTNALIESYVSGTEITVPVLGSSKPRVLPAIEIIPKNEFYDYASKYDEGGSRHIVPARISQDATAVASRAALLAHQILGCCGVSRTDMIIDADDRAWVIETNTIPGMTATSLLPDAASYVGISNANLYELFIQWAIDAWQETRLRSQG
ncbi:MAG: D-alanine--D-alanine ligase [Coriobacteriales bacterium]|jgi:D-alanine-D-alanine ligase|nr:D-alanine--D-alanine ligase [Coriobacteriales bacterium]